MSSFVRRMQRQVMPSQVVHRHVDEDGNPVGKPFANPARKVFFNGRGDRLGVSNPKCKARLAREAREAKRRRPA